MVTGRFRAVLWEFPSLIGRLKLHAHPPSSSMQAAFPSLIGRLKLETLLQIQGPLQSFPSLIGRLKLAVIFMPTLPPRVSIPHR